MDISPAAPNIMQVAPAMQIQQNNNQELTATRVEEASQNQRIADERRDGTTASKNAQANGEGESGGAGLSIKPPEERSSAMARQNVDNSTGDKINPNTNKDREGQSTNASHEENALLQQLKAQDREVRNHEQAHINASGGHASGPPSFSFETGPDGKQYAVSGQVSIDTSTIEGDPEATIAKMSLVQQAALAPAQPSAQDQQVAAAAGAKASEARSELQAKKYEENEQADASNHNNESYREKSRRSLDQIA